MQGESEEMMETLRAAGLATTENAENMLYMTNVLTKNKIEIRRNLWKNGFHHHMANS